MESLGKGGWAIGLKLPLVQLSGTPAIPTFPTTAVSSLRDEKHPNAAGKVNYFFVPVFSRSPPTAIRWSIQHGSAICNRFNFRCVGRERTCWIFKKEPFPLQPHAPNEGSKSVIPHSVLKEPHDVALSQQSGPPHSLPSRARNTHTNTHSFI